MEWTKEQEKAIKTKDCNLLVSAGAGSGKTAVLVERIVNMVINDKVDITNILVVTFTNAAASEMKERILNKLYERLDENPENIWLQQQVINMGNANITTIHSFCLGVIKQYYYEIGIEPNLKIANEIDNQLMKYEILNEMFDEEYQLENADKEFINLLEMFDEKNEKDNLKEIILKIYNFVINQPFKEKVYAQLLKGIDTSCLSDFENTIWGKEYINQTIYTIKKIIEQHDIILDILSDDDKQIEFYENSKNKAIKLLNIENKKWDEVILLLNSYTLDRRVQMRGYDDNTKEIVSAHWDNIKKMQKDISCNMFEKDILKQSEVNKKEIEYLIKMVENFDTRFKAKKEKNKVIDFNDFEHYALQILLSYSKSGEIVPSNVAKEYRKKFVEILIDEYQDSNYIQDYILTVISKCDEGQPNIFMVGDVKQSIYKFRGAKPEIFLQKYYTYTCDMDSKYKKINLYKNFRSTEEILEYINYIFSKIMTKEVGQLDYTTEEFLNYGAQYADIETNNSKIEIDVIDLAESAETEIEEEETEEIKSENIEYEAQYIANRIQQLISDKYQVLDKKTREYRNVKYSDIVILLRSTKGTATVFNQVFKENHIPIYIDNMVGYLDELEVTEVLGFLQIIDNPYQDIPLISVLKSPFGNFDDNELAQIRQYDTTGYFYTAMQKVSTINEKVNDFLIKLNKYMQDAKLLTVSHLIWNIYEDYKYIEYMRKYKDYDNKKANLILLFERARQFEESSYKGLFNFINFIFKIKDNNQDMGSATILGENDDVVRLMSIHKSKGLEFPVVFLSNTDRKFNFKDLSSKMLIDQQLLIGNEIIDLEKRISYSSIFKKVIAKKMKQDIVAEEMRMLYVALTRAKEKLIITGVSKDIDKTILKSTTSITDNLTSYLSLMFNAIFSNSYTKNLDINYIKCGDIKNGFNADNEQQNDIELRNICNNNIQRIDKNDLDNEKYKCICDQMSFEYDKDYLQLLPHKVSVSEIKQINQEKQENSINIYDSIEPKWINAMNNTKKNNVSPMEKGNIYHYIFQNLDFSKTYNIQQLEQEIRSMKKITDIEYSIIDIEKIYDFTTTDIYKQIQNAQRIYKEQTFMLEVSINDVKDIFGIDNVDEKQNDTILIQGTIDMFYIKDNEIVIVDYKTDNIQHKDEIIKRYKIQLDYYKKALERLLNMKVKNSYIYLINTCDVIEME